MVDISALTQRLYEDESLTADLDDAEAQKLLTWAEAQIEPITRYYPEDTSAEEIFDTLREFVKRVSRVVGRRADLTPEEITAMLGKIATSAQTLNAGTIPLQAQASAENIQAAPPATAIDMLTSWVSLHAPKPSSDAMPNFTPQSAPIEAETPSQVDTVEPETPPQFAPVEQENIPLLDTRPTPPMLAPPEETPLLSGGDDSEDEPDLSSHEAPTKPHRY